MMMNIINFSTTETEFPSFTICPDFDVAYKEDVLEKYKTSKWDMRGLRFPNTRSKNLSTLQFFKMVTYNLTEIVTSMSIETINDQFFSVCLLCTNIEKKHVLGYVTIRLKIVFQQKSSRLEKLY